MRIRGKDKARNGGAPDSTEVVKLLLKPDYCDPQTPFDSLMRDLLHRIIEEEGSITLDITNMIRPEVNPRPQGRICWDYGAWVNNEKMRNSGEEVPVEQVGKLEITLWFEPE